MSRSIDYGKLMHRAMRGLIQEVLCYVRDNGLPGAHHFFITFDTTHPDLAIADWLRERYPSEMTVVMQHWYDNLEVTDDGFSVTLNFGDRPEPLYIPFDAIRTFVDPSVEFGLRFDGHDEDEDETPSEASAPLPVGDSATPKDGGDDSALPEHKDAEVVSLDSFRK